MAGKPIVGLQHSTLFTHFAPVEVHLQGMNISRHQRCAEKCAQGYSKRAVPYMVLTMAALLKQFFEGHTTH
jgi:hypothetical protein